MAMNKPNDIFNLDKFGLFCGQAPDITIAPGPLKGKKNERSYNFFGLELL